MQIFQMILTFNQWHVRFLGVKAADCEAREIRRLQCKKNNSHALGSLVIIWLELMDKVNLKDTANAKISSISMFLLL